MFSAEVEEEMKCENDLCYWWQGGDCSGFKGMGFSKDCIKRKDFLAREPHMEWAEEKVKDDMAWHKAVAETEVETWMRLEKAGMLDDNGFYEMQVVHHLAEHAHLEFMLMRAKGEA